MEEKKLSRFKKSYLLTRGAWRSLKLDKELLAIPLLSIATSLVILAIAFVVAAIIGDINGSILVKNAISSGEAPQPSVLGYISLVVLGAILATVSAIASGAIIHGAIERFNGNNPTVRSSIGAAWKRARSLTLFALFSYAIGYVISAIAERIPFGGRVIAWLGGTAWGIATFFAIPSIMTSDKQLTPVKATKSSVATLKLVWGESLIANISIGIVSGLVVAAYVVVAVTTAVVAALLSAPTAIYVALGVLAVIVIFALAITLTVLEAFVKAALHHYATTGESPVTFDQNILRQAFTRKKARKLFST